MTLETGVMQLDRELPVAAEVSGFSGAASAGFIYRSVRFLGSVRTHPSAVAGLALIALFVVVALAAPVIAPHPVSELNLANRFLPPVFLEGGRWNYIFGTDQMGQDVFSRVLYGARVSIVIGLVSVLISIGIGTVLGSLAGYYRGWADRALSRVADLLMAFPYLLFTIFAMAVLGPGIINLILALSFKAWVEFFRLVRGEVMAETTREYVDAARILGQKPLVIIVREIFPNIVHSIVVLGTLRLGFMIIMEASLSFLGLGVPPDIPAWGSMVAAGRDFMLRAWWVSTMPGLAIVVLVLGVNLFGEGLRELSDPRLQMGKGD